MVIMSAKMMAEQYAKDHGYVIEHMDFMGVPDMARVYAKDPTGATDVAEIVCYQPIEYNYVIMAYGSNGEQIDSTSKSNALANGGRIQLAENTNLKP